MNKKNNEKLKKEKKVKQQKNKKTTSNIKKVNVKTKKEKKVTKKKSFAEKILKFIRENLYDIVLAIFSIIALVIGTFAIGFKKAFIIVVLIDIVIWFFPIVSFIGSKTKRKFKRRTLAQIFLWCLILGLLACIGFATYIVLKAPEFNPNNLYSKEATIIYDKDGEIIAKIGSQLREKITYDELPEILVDAIIATEDSQFFEHNGFNPLRFLKASVSQVLGNGGGGASTITMQVSKNAFTSFESSGFDGIVRKFTDIYLSIFKIEKTYTKEEILEFYVNSYYMGGGAYGVEQACQNYFGKSVSEINLSEAALIAGVFKGGGAYDPYIYPENAEARRQVVLALMQRHGYITEEERQIALQLTVDDIIVKDRESVSYQAFIDTVVAEVQEKTGQNPYSVPMEIFTTMDAKKQEHINKIMSGQGSYKWRNDVVQAGIAVTDTNTGAIVAIGAGRNRKGANTWNYATMNSRQIGSTAKPLYDYGPAIEYNNLSPAQPIVDEPHSYSGGIAMNNWDGGYEGYMTMRRALVVSRNVPALKTFQTLKNNNIKTFVTNLGLHPQIENGMVFESHSIGGYEGESPLSMAAAYAAFANGGTYIEPYSFTKIIYRESNEEFVNTYETKKAMSEATAFLITNMLIDGAVYNIGTNSINGIQFTNKTGTTNFPGYVFQQYKLPYNAVNDLWSVGYSRDYSIAVWYGYDKISSQYYNVSNGDHTRLFREVAKGVLTGTKYFTKPSSVIQVEIEKDNSEIKLPSEYTPDSFRTIEYFKIGTEPTEVSTRFAQLSNVTGINISRNDTSINLSWNSIGEINEFNQDYLTTEFSKIFNNETQLKKFVDLRLEENNTILGQVEYEVYLKNEDDSLTLLGATQNNYFEYTPAILKNGTFNFVIKTTYANFKSNASNGAEAGISINDIAATVTSNINGISNITIGLNEAYTEPEKPVIVLEGMEDVTEQSNIHKTITNSNGDTVHSINTDVEDVFTITYTVEYKNHTKVLTKTITVQNSQTEE